MLHTLALLVGAVLVALAVSEVALRGLGISYPVFSQIDHELGASLRPGASGRYTREGDADVRISTAGMRDREHSITKPLQSLRIAVLGDSYAEAIQVPLEETFWSVLERDLKTCPAMRGREPEVLNFGVSGYGTAQELLMLRHRVWAYSPDVIVVAFVTGNDVRNNSRVLEGEDRKPYFALEQGSLVADYHFRESLGFRLRETAAVRWMKAGWDATRIGQVIGEVRRIMHVSQWNASRSLFDTVHANAATNDSRDSGPMKAMDLGEEGLDAEVYREPQHPAWKQAWEITEQLLLTMHEEVKAKGADFLVVTLSNSPQVHPDPSVRRAFEAYLGVPDLFYPDTRIHELGRRHGIRVLSLAPALQQYAESRRVFLHGFERSGLGKGHWNQAGHHAAGRMIAAALCS